MGSVTTYNEGKHNPNVLHIRRDLWEQTVEDVKKLKEECNKARYLANFYFFWSTTERPGANPCFVESSMLKRSGQLLSPDWQPGQSVP